MLRLHPVSSLLVLALAASTLSAAAPETLHAHCSVGPSTGHPDQFSLRDFDGSCGDDDSHCSNFNSDPFSRFTGITRADLAREGAQLTATVASEPGTFTCAGAVHQGVLMGQSTFVPSPEFVSRMETLGLTGYTSQKLEAYAFTGVTSSYAKSLKDAGVKGITTDNLIALRIFNVDPPYIASLVALGYPMPNADELIALRVQKVDAEEVRQIRALGYEPSFDELIQMRIFNITPAFVRSMRARGLKDLTIAKLVQIKIFKLDE